VKILVGTEENDHTLATQMLGVSVSGSIPVASCMRGKIILGSQLCIRILRPRSVEMPRLALKMNKAIAVMGVL
jgi:hypothetical protein